MSSTVMGRHGVRLAVVGLVLALAGCNRRIEQRDEAEESSRSSSGAGGSSGASNHTSTSSGETSESTSGGIEPLRCRDDEVQCGSECANLRWSEDHCGSCNHACTVVGGGGECWEGECPPRRYCALIEEGHMTCASVCESHGVTCVDSEPEVPPACGGKTYGLFYELTPDFSCDVGYYAVASLMGGCHDPIDWSVEAGANGGGPPGAVGCCCTQP